MFKRILHELIPFAVVGVVSMTVIYGCKVGSYWAYG
jgi:hypothetical protein